MTPRTFAFSVPGPPVGKGRPRFARVGAFVRTYTPEKTQSYENWVAMCAQKAMAETQTAFPWLGPLAVSVQFYLPRPKKPKFSRPCGRPDLDNLIKSLEDGMARAGIFANDSQIVEVSAVKLYPEGQEAPGADVEVTRL